MLWTDEVVAHMRELVADGLSASQIGRVLRVTRNAVIGKLARLHVSLNGHKSAPPKPKALPPQPKRRPIVMKDDAGKPAEVIKPPPFLGLSIAELSAKQCHYASEAEWYPPHTFCGQPCRDGSAYCEFHHRVVWHKPPAARFKPGPVRRL